MVVVAKGIQVTSEVPPSAGTQLDTFLLANFDCVEESAKVVKTQPKTDKTVSSSNEKGVREIIENLRLEIESGKLDCFKH